MVEKVFSATTIGLQTQLVEIEIDISSGMPAVIMVGLGDKAVQESKERIRTGLKQSGFEFPLGKITVNLAPAGVIKTGTQFDLPISLGILKQIGAIKSKNSSPVKSLFLGELSLDGSLRAISGVLTICIWAKNNGFDEVYIPASNRSEAELVGGIKIFALDNLTQLVNHFNGTAIMQAIEPKNLQTLVKGREEFKINNSETGQNSEVKQELYVNDMAYIKGQSMAKRGLEIAASGGHNVMFIGQPGSGKTLLARSYATILPSMIEEEILDVTQIYSVAGLLEGGQIIHKRPFRAPHHSSSHISLVGGGTKLRPGEISLAHRGVLFLDEFPEFSRETLESLRQPLEDGFVQISRISGTVIYPAKFYLLAAANPTPSGFNTGDPDSFARPVMQGAIARYQAKFSGPIMDRIDIHVEVNRPQKDELQSTALAEPSLAIAKRVQAARDIQTKRFKDQPGVTCNGEMNLETIQKYCHLDQKCETLMSQAIEKFKLSARSYMRILKLSRTIADLDNSESIQVKHLAESLQFRSKIG